MRISDWSSDVCSSDLQVLVATRLWLKEQLARTQALCIEAADVALQRARAEAGVPLPGYTHLQRAVVSSAGMWWAGWAEAFIDDSQRARDTAAWVDANPLGSAAGYGVNLALDRDHRSEEHTSELQSLMRISYAVFCLKKKNNNEP